MGARYQSVCPSAYPSTHPCYAAAAASKLLYLLIVSRAFLAGLPEARMAESSSSRWLGINIVRLFDFIILNYVRPKAGLG